MAGVMKVTAPMALARTQSDTVVYLYEGDIVPDGLTKESLEHLSSLGFITADDDSAPDSRPTPKGRPASKADDSK